MPRLDFLDISHWQSDRGAIDWNKVRAQGIVGAIIKATEGTSYVDPGYKKNRDGALEAGLQVATYHFLKAGAVDDQMQHYIETVMPRFGERLVIDYEDGNLTYPDLRKAVLYLQQRVADCEISVYGSAKLTDDVRAAGSAAEIDMKGTSCWMARYSSSPPAFASNAWPAYSAWQYSQEGKVNGITGAVDLNTFNGSVDACVQWIGPPTKTPEPVPEPEPTTHASVVALTLPAGTDILISVNDAIVWSGKAP